MARFHTDTFLPFLVCAGTGRLDPFYPEQEQPLKQKIARKPRRFRRKPQAKTNAKKAKIECSDQQDKPANAAAVPTPEVEVPLNTAKIANATESVLVNVKIQRTGARHCLERDSKDVKCTLCNRSTTLKHKAQFDKSENCLGRYESVSHAQVRSKAINNVGWAVDQMRKCCNGRGGAHVRCNILF